MTDRRLVPSSFALPALFLYPSLALLYSPSPLSVALASVGRSVGCLARGEHAREREFVRRWRETKNAERRRAGVSGRT